MPPPSLPASKMFGDGGSTQMMMVVPVRQVEFGEGFPTVLRFVDAIDLRRVGYLRIRGVDEDGEYS